MSFVIIKSETATPGLFMAGDVSVLRVISKKRVQRDRTGPRGTRSSSQVGKGKQECAGLLPLLCWDSDSRTIQGERSTRNWHEKKLVEVANWKGEEI